MYSLNNEMFYVDINCDVDNYIYYYNMETEVNKAVNKVVAEDILKNRPISDAVRKKINEKGYTRGNGSAEYGVMGSYNTKTGEVDFMHGLGMIGITATVNNAIAGAILQRAIYYCPKDTGYLASTGRIETLDNGKCRIVFDCPYAWYVHEYTWKRHRYPECAKFLTRAIQEISAIYGLG